jgi:hypothetical protein
MDMNLRQLLDVLSADEKVALAEAAGTERVYLHQLADGHRNPSPRLAQRLVKCDSRLTLAELRPDVWGLDSEAA